MKNPTVQGRHHDTWASCSRVMRPSAYRLPAPLTIKFHSLDLKEDVEVWPAGTSEQGARVFLTD